MGGATERVSLVVQEFHETLHSLLLWLAQAEAKLGAVNPGDPSMTGAALLEHRVTLLVSQRLARKRRQPQCRDRKHIGGKTLSGWLENLYFLVS